MAYSTRRQWANTCSYQGGPMPCSAYVPACAVKPGASLNEARTERVLLSRIADRRGDYFSHRSGGNSEPFALANERKRGIGGRFHAHHCNCRNCLFFNLHGGIRGELDVAERWRHASELRSADGASSSVLLPDCSHAGEWLKERVPLHTYGSDWQRREQHLYAQHRFRP